MYHYKFTAGALVDSKESIIKLMKLDTIPVSLAFDLRLMYPRLKEIVTAFEMQKDELVKKFGDNVGPNLWQILPGHINLPIFTSELEKLRSVVVEIDGPEISEKIIRELDKGLSAADILAISEFIPEHRTKTN